MSTALTTGVQSRPGYPSLGELAGRFWELCKWGTNGKPPEREPDPFDPKSKLWRGAIAVQNVRAVLICIVVFCWAIYGFVRFLEWSW